MFPSYHGGSQARCSLFTRMFSQCPQLLRRSLAIKVFSRQDVPYFSQFSQCPKLPRAFADQLSQQKRGLEKQISFQIPLEECIFVGQYETTCAQNPFYSATCKQSKYNNNETYDKGRKKNKEQHIRVEL